MMVRLTAPPIQPVDPPPVVRGQAPTADQAGQRFGDPRTNDSRTMPAASAPASRPNPTPYYESLIGQGWQPVTRAPMSPRYGAAAPVQLGQPQFGSQSRP
jgi:hypothetical protein